MHSAEDGFLPLNLGNAAECELFMLPGVSAPVSAFMVGPIRITRLEFRDWLAIEKNQFIDDLQDIYVYGRQPWYCVFGGGDPQASEEARVLRTYDRERLVRRLTLALRLVREEPILDPTQYIVYRRCNGQNVREPRLLGRGGYHSAVITKLAPGDLALLEAVFHALEVLDSFRGGGPLILATHLFQASYSVAAMDPRDRILPLLGALEALTGGLEQPLRSIRWPDDRVGRFLARYRQLRNEIAHGGEAGASSDVSTLRLVVRCLLCEGISTELTAPTENRSAGGPLLRGMRSRTVFGAMRLAETRAKYQGWGNFGNGPSRDDGSDSP
ncbi:MAG: hypothetical protein K8T20_12915 [Planctomycetes bacterium]|nr:hypothetical protein [Planctomycetota bacterium]